MNIELQFVTEPDLVSHAIRWFTWSEFSHVDIVLPNGYLLGAHVSGGVAIRPAKYAAWSKVRRATIYGCQPRILTAAGSQIGQPYDLGAILGLLWRNEHWRHPGQWFCSELIAWAFESCGCPLLNGEYWRITPRDLWMSPLLKRDFP